MKYGLSVMAIAMTTVAALQAGEMPKAKTFTNTMGMKLVRIEPGSFVMGQRQGGDWDERPVHRVRISKPFYIAATEVTNL